ncbi:hypothetical protein LSH36_271g06030 [Paralvinella palmiformis]|uniref:Protein kinase domain-containing protein n=1 Tax=Paralvinella palmiformis TaxID=53620 RepID=A0AAD9JKH4_9ANNE|nr:hypothetical protein LSH36_271g06030 [Paralvinella palmiformis]
MIVFFLNSKVYHICSLGGKDHSQVGWFDPDHNKTLDAISTLQATPTNMFYIAVGCACGFIVLVALIVALYYVKSQKSSPTGERLSETSSSKGLTNHTTQSFLRPETPSNSVTNLFPNDYHCLGDNENRPIKWLAPEALQDKKFTPASDVWSFGVLLWELMMMGLQPYSDIDPFEMLTYLKEGYRIAQPPNCPDQLFAVMACCWAVAPDERPKITQLQLCLQDFYQALGRFV